MTLPRAHRIDGVSPGTRTGRAGGAARAGLVLTYATDCGEVEFSLSRRSPSSATLEPATGFGLLVALNGFEATRDGRSHDRACSR